MAPTTHGALGTLAEVRAAQGRHRDATLLTRQRYEVPPSPESLFERAEARDHQSRADVSAPENRGRHRVAPAW